MPNEKLVIGTPLYFFENRRLFRCFISHISPPYIFVDNYSNDETVILFHWSQISSGGLIFKPCVFLPNNYTLKNYKKKFTSKNLFPRPKKHQCDFSVMVTRDLDKMCNYITLQNKNNIHYYTNSARKAIKDYASDLDAGRHDREDIEKNVFFSALEQIAKFEEHSDYVKSFKQKVASK